MSDIDRQPTADLNAAQSSEKIKEIATAARTCMFTTLPDVFPPQTCPMSLQDVDEQGTLWFLSSSHSDKNKDLARDARVTLTFQNDAKLQYLSLAGQATVHDDSATIDAHWTSLANAWFKGKDDPRLTVIAVHPSSGHYWDSQSGKFIAMAKMTFAAMTGAQIDDGGVDGSLKL